MCVVHVRCEWWKQWFEFSAVQLRQFKQWACLWLWASWWGNFRWSKPTIDWRRRKPSHLRCLFAWRLFDYSDAFFSVDCKVLNKYLIFNSASVVQFQIRLLVASIRHCAKRHVSTEILLSNDPLQPHQQPRGHSEMFWFASQIELTARFWFIC